MALLAFDFETALIAPGEQIPRAVCMSFMGSQDPARLVVAREGMGYLEFALQDPSTVIIGANLAYDALVAIRCAFEQFGAAYGHRFTALLLGAYRAGRVRDVLVSENIWSIEHRGMIFHENGLDAVALRRCGMQLDKANPWRLRFAELDGLPVSSYPPEAANYALDDAVATYAVALKQDAFVAENPAEHAFQAFADLALKLTSARGLRTHGFSVEALGEDVAALMVECRQELVGAGLVLPDLKVDPELRREMKRRYGKDYWDRLMNNPGQLAAIAPTIEAGNWPGVELAKWTKKTKAAQDRIVAAYERMGREPPRVVKKADGKRSLGGISTDGDSCAMSEDPILETYHEYSTFSKVISTDLKMLRSGAETPIHTHFHVLRETTRTASTAPNVQNVRRLPGIRECFVPRPGFVFVDADFKMLELHSLAEVCYRVFGWSLLGDALNAGRDPHAEMAAVILATTYEDIQARREAGDDAADTARTAGKGVNFGAPGGLGPDSFVSYCWKGYGIRITLEKSRELIGLYKQKWREMQQYFRWIDSHKYGSGRYRMQAPGGGVTRADMTYCSACNFPFQHLGARVAKRALQRMAERVLGCGPLGTSDPLVGCHMVNFVHDSITTEVPDDGLLTLRAKEIRATMEAAAAEELQHVRCGVDLVVSRQWSKKAKLIVDASGNFQPWDVREACIKAADKAIRSGVSRDKLFEHLSKKEKWPRAIVRELLADRRIDA